MRQASMVRRTGIAKKEAAIAAGAIFLAKNNKDPLYDKLKRYRDLWQETKNKIIQKYHTKSMQSWAVAQNKKR